MAIDGLIIIDNSGRPIIQSGFRSSLPAYPLLHIDALNAALAASPNPDPVLYLPLEPPSACCHVPVGSELRVLAPVSGDVDPLVAFAFIDAFLIILTEYLGSVSASTLRDNFDVVYQLLEETLDASGHPLTTAPNALRDIVTPPSLLSKLLANMSLGGSGAGMNGSGGGAGAFASPIPWRKAGVRYNNNEIYFDVVEELRALVNKNGTPLSSTVWGKIETNAKLSGTPDLLLTFANPQVLADCAFHPCVRLQRWAQDKALSFVPPDGRFTLLDFRYSPSHTSTSTSTSAPTLANKDLVPLPFTLRASLTLTGQTAEVEATITARRALDTLVLELSLGSESATGVSASVSSSSSHSHFSSNGRGGGERDVIGAGKGWSYDPRKNMLRWEIPRAESGSSWVVRGSWSSQNRPARALNISFQTPAHGFSGLRVDQLKVRSTGVAGETYKPYKGVRAMGSGVVEWRI